MEVPPKMAAKTSFTRCSMQCQKAEQDLHDQCGRNSRSSKGHNSCDKYSILDAIATIIMQYDIRRYSRTFKTSSQEHWPTTLTSCLTTHPSANHQSPWLTNPGHSRPFAFQIYSFLRCPRSLKWHISFLKMSNRETSLCP